MGRATHPAPHAPSPLADAPSPQAGGGAGGGELGAVVSLMQPALTEHHTLETFSGNGNKVGRRETGTPDVTGLNS